MKLVTAIHTFKKNELFRVDIDLDTRALKTQLPTENVFLISARDADSAQIQAQNWFCGVSGVSAPKTIGDVISMNMDFANYVIKDFKAKNGFKAPETNIDSAVKVTVSAPMTYGDALSLIRVKDVRKNFLLSIFEDLDAIPKSA